LEALAEVESAVANHEEGTAIVLLKEEIEDERLKETVEALDYQVIAISSGE